MEITRRKLIAGTGATIVGGFAVTQMGGCGPGEDTIDSIDEIPTDGRLVSITGEVVESRAGSVVIDDGTGVAVAGTRGQPAPPTGTCVTVDGEPMDCIGCVEDGHAIETYGFHTNG